MKYTFLYLAPFFPFLLNLWAQDSGRPDRPNVVIILADDLGWQDVGCYDIDEPTPMETPNIDGLARRGVPGFAARLQGAKGRRLGHAAVGEAE